MISRRALLLGGAGGAVGLGVLDPRVRRRVFGVDTASHLVPPSTTEQLVSGSFRSAAMSETTGFTVVYPSAPTSLPMLLHLHGRTGTHRDVERLGPFLSDAVRGGAAPFAVVGVDGGDHSYYHRRATGQDPQRMLLEELLPLLATRGLTTDRFAVGGLSMGGYGALLLAETLGPSRIAAVAVDSPAIFLKVQDSAGGAFDGSADFAAHNVLKASPRLAGMPLRVTCGTSDPFLPGVRDLLGRVPGAERDLGPGAHNQLWWDHAAPGQLAFVARHLS